MAATTITVKFKKPIAIGLPNNGVLAPNLYAKTKTVAGFASPVPVQDYDFDDEYDIVLLPETPEELPAHFANLGDEMKAAFTTQQVTSLAANHNANNLTRTALAQYEREGVIEVTHDSFKDGAKDAKARPEDSLAAKSARANEDDPNPHQPRAAVGSDANFQAATERDAAFGDASSVPTNEDPQPSEKRKKVLKDAKGGNDPGTPSKTVTSPATPGATEEQTTKQV